MSGPPTGPVSGRMRAPLRRPACVPGAFMRALVPLRQIVAPIIPVWAVLAPACSVAADLSPNEDVSIRWDNTFKFSSGYRLQQPSESLISNINLDDGDRNITRGWMSNRFDVLSEFDIQRRGFGARMSGAAWYDTVYNRTNDNTSPATANASSVPYDEFTRASQSTAGKKAELLDAFVFGQFDLGQAHRLSARLGQYSMLWGTSLFFAANGIAKGMAPVDVYKLNLPGAQAKETLLPVRQVSATLSLTDATSVEAYYQFKFRPTRLAPSGSYFSATDWMGDGGERFLFSSTYGVNRGANITGHHQANIGLALNTRSDLLDTDFGFYALRYQDTSPQTVMQVASGSYFLAYPQNVRMLGMSFARLLGDANVSGELSARWGQPLWAADSANALEAGADPSALNLSRNTLWPTARTLHFNVSTVWVLPTSPYWGGASLTAELMANKALALERNGGNIDPSRSRGAAAARVIFSPTYYQVTSGLDVSPSFNLGWAFRGNSMIDGGTLPFAGSPDHGGDLVLGVDAVYRTRYKFNMAWTHYLGRADTQPFLDRDYIRFSMQTTF
jgi:hypothetical protein